jgi:DNA-binding transcriptional LysR family regulator
MAGMNEIDPLDLDGHLLALLVAVHAEGSITRAAERLGVTQSAVSHGLDRLRALLDDPLFVKSGRGIAPTTRADSLALQAAALLDGLKRLAAAETFEPAKLDTALTIAANELQRDLLLPPLLARLREDAPRVRLRVVPSNAPTPDALRSGAWQLLLTPRPPDVGDLRHKRLFADGWRVFYDPAVRAAPRSLAEYLAAEHVTVVYESGRPLTVDDHLAMAGATRRFAVEVAAFSGVARFVAGSDRLATMPARLRGGVLRGLADAAVPLPTPELPMYMVWHQRHHDDAMHAWLRAAVEAVASAAA